jgi:hypothetical protein
VIDTIGSISSIGAFILAGVIASIGISQSKKKDTDRFYECLEAMTNYKIELESALTSYAKYSNDIGIFNNLDARYSAFVNHYFSAKTFNQNYIKIMHLKIFKENL